MVKIRLSRGGVKKRPFYRIIAIDSRRQTKGRALEFLGTFDPKPDQEVINVKLDRVQAWVAKGAQLSPAVKALIRRSKKQTQASANAGG